MLLAGMRFHDPSKRPLGGYKNIGYKDALIFFQFGGVQPPAVFFSPASSVASIPAIFDLQQQSKKNLYRLL